MDEKISIVKDKNFTFAHKGYLIFTMVVNASAVGGCHIVCPISNYRDRCMSFRKKGWSERHARDAPFFFIICLQRRKGTVSVTGQMSPQLYLLNK